MRCVLVVLLALYWVVINILTAFFDDGTDSRFLQWFMGVDERGHNNGRLLMSPMDIIFYALILAMLVS